MTASSPKRGAGTSHPWRRLELHHLYFLLAALQALAIGSTIWLGDRALKIDRESAKFAELWSGRTNEFVRLSELAAAVNAPGNDVFDSRDLERESHRLEQATARFQQLMQQIRGKIVDDATSADATIFLCRLDQIDQRVSAIEKHAKAIFAATAVGDERQAGESMAAMDQQFAAVPSDVTWLCQHVREIQRREFAAHTAEAESLQQKETALLCCLVVLMCAAGWYGFRLTTNVSRANQNAAHLSAIVESSDDAIIGMSLDGLITAWNHGAERLYGYSSREIVGKPVQTLVPRDRIDEKVFVVETSDPSHGVKRFDTIRRRKDGSLIDVSLTISPVYSASGEIIGVSKIARDITVQKLAEQRLQDSEARAKAVFDTAADAVITSDEQGRIQSFNPAAEGVFGYRAEEVIGRNISILMPAPYQDEHDGYLAHYFRTGEKRIIGSGREVLGLRKSGEQFPLELAVSELLQGDIRTFTGIVRDITERKRLEKDREDYTKLVEEAWTKLEVQAATLELQTQELEQAREAAERANQAKSEFLANMSHELRTPMNSIIGFTQRLLKKLGGSLEPQHLDALQTIDRNSRHLLGLINDILDLSKIEAGRMDLKRSEFDLVQVVQEVAGQTSSLTDAKPLKMVLDLPDDPIPIDADRVKVVQIVTNLVSNGVKYTERGTVTVSVRQDVNDELGPCARVSVQDTGVGIKEEDQARLFKKFSQLDSSTSRPVGGTGLGLFITAQYVHMHGGTVAVASEVGVGSTFTITLPLKPAATSTKRLAIESSSARPAGVEADPPGERPSDSLTIFPVDDRIPHAILAQ